MKNLACFNLLLFTLLVFSSCHKSEELSLDIVIIQLNQKGTQLVESTSDFGISLFKAVVISENNNTNLMISPYSVSQALAMTYNGANGDTKTAMENTLGFNGLTLDEININFKQISEALLSIDKKVSVLSANSIWYRDDFPILPSFIDINKNFYNADVNALDFNLPGAKNLINNWVAEKTNNKITEIVDQINAETVMYLINALYFKGPWKYEFNKSKNFNNNFKLSDGSYRQVEMMTQCADLKYYENDATQLIELPYGQGNWVMDLILPAEGKTLNGFIGDLSSETWKSWVNSLSGFSQISLSFPPFKFEYSKSLNDILYDLGMAVAFNPVEADFSKINESLQLYISDVKHKTFIEVNEEGTEAAAATSVEIGYTSAGPSIIFDRPFLFVIREITTGTILFIGKVENPVR